MGVSMACHDAPMPPRRTWLVWVKSAVRVNSGWPMAAPAKASAARAKGNSVRGVLLMQSAFWFLRDDLTQADVLP